MKDIVRIIIEKLRFEKGYEQNWTIEIFTIHKIIPRVPVVYKLKDLSGEIIKGIFYEPERQIRHITCGKSNKNKKKKRKNRIFC